MDCVRRQECTVRVLENRNRWEALLSDRRPLEIPPEIAKSQIAHPNLMYFNLQRALKVQEFKDVIGIPTKLNAL